MQAVRPEIVVVTVSPSTFTVVLNVRCSSPRNNRADIDNMLDTGETSLRGGQDIGENQSTTYDW